MFSFGLAPIENFYTRNNNGVVILLHLLIYHHFLFTSFKIIVFDRNHNIKSNPVIFLVHLSHEFYYPYIYFWNFHFTTVVLYLTQFPSSPLDHFMDWVFFIYDFFKKAMWCLVDTWQSAVPEERQKIYGVEFAVLITCKYSQTWQ